MKSYKMKRTTKFQTFPDTINILWSESWEKCDNSDRVPDGNKKQGYLKSAPCALVQHPPRILQIRFKKA